MRRTLLPLLLVVSFGLAGCGSLPMPDPSSTPSPSDSGSEGAVGEDSVPPTGATVIGDLGDPCALLTRSEIQKALGVAVLGSARGEVKADGSQVCAWGMDAGSSTAAALGSYVGKLGTSDWAKMIDGMGSATAVFGVVLQRTDPPDLSDDSSDDGDTPSAPGVSFTKVSVGASGGVVVATTNGGAAFTNDGIHTSLTLMDLIAGPPDPAALETLLTKAYDRL